MLVVKLFGDATLLVEGCRGFVEYIVFCAFINEARAFRHITSLVGRVLLIWCRSNATLDTIIAALFYNNSWRWWTIKIVLKCSNRNRCHGNICIYIIFIIIILLYIYDEDDDDEDNDDVYYLLNVNSIIRYTIYDILKLCELFSMQTVTPKSRLHQKYSH
jgi:hypothetical protein